MRPRIWFPHPGKTPSDRQGPVVGSHPVVEIELPMCGSIQRAGRTEEGAPDSEAPS